MGGYTPTPLIPACQLVACLQALGHVRAMICLRVHSPFSIFCARCVAVFLENVSKWKLSYFETCAIAQVRERIFYLVESLPGLLDCKLVGAILVMYL